MLKAIFFNAIFILAISISAFAEGEGNAANDFGRDKPKNKFSAENNTLGKHQLNSFSLRSGMYFKGENLINSEASSANAGASFNIINNNSTLQKGQNSYLLPYKKKAVLNKLTFNPNELLRNYSAR